jgi:hypothetical protein
LSSPLAADPTPPDGQDVAAAVGFANPLITVTINPLEQNEMTFIADSPESRRVSIGSASSLGRTDCNDKMGIEPAK